jgi:hypothetical protein
MIEPAAIRPDDWNIALFVHVLGALTLVGAVVMSLAFLRAARRDGTLASVRLGYRALLLGALPAYLVMRVGSEWIGAKEHVEDIKPTPGWIDIGYAAADIGLLLLLIATVASGLAVRRLRRDEASGAGRGVALATGLTGLLIVMYAVAIWAMASKPM